MTHKAFDDVWARPEQRKRTFYHAVASNGNQNIRGSARDKFTHAVIPYNEMNYPNEMVYAFYSGDKERADTLCKRLNNNSYNAFEWEVVEVKKITEREANQLKRLEKKRFAEWHEKERNLINVSNP